jgi:hypothetical protein
MYEAVPQKTWSWVGTVLGRCNSTWINWLIGYNSRDPDYIPAGRQTSGPNQMRSQSLHGVCVRLRNSSVTIPCVYTEIWAKHLPTTSLDRYRYANLLGLLLAGRNIVWLTSKTTIPLKLGMSSTDGMKYDTNDRKCDMRQSNLSSEALHCTRNSNSRTYRI